MTTSESIDPADTKAVIAHLEAQIENIRKARDEQPTRLAAARKEADEARGWALIEEPWDTLVSAIPTNNAEGKRTGDSLTLPSIDAKEMFGARRAFDILDCEDWDRIEEVQTRYFSMVNGDTGLLFLLFSSALATVASLVVPEMLYDLEQHASNYDARVMLAEARAKAWRSRVSELRGNHDDAGPYGFAWGRRCLMKPP